MRISSNRNDFIDTWLVEMPMGIDETDYYEQIVQNIKEKIQHNAEVIKLPNNLYKIQGHQIVLYWYELNEKITLCAELDIRPQGLRVNMISKNKDFNNKPPYASDLYNAILNDSNRPIRIESDTQLSEKGYAIWKRLYRMGNKITVYDPTNPGQTYHTLNSIDDMDNFIKYKDSLYKKYQFILSKDGEMLSESRIFFNNRRFRELAGLDLED